MFAACATQRERILAHLKLAPITPIHALRFYGCMRLGARIWELRRAGHWIERSMIDVTTRDGTAHVARYRLVRL